MKQWSAGRGRERKMRARARQFSRKTVDGYGYEIRVSKRGAPPDRVDEIWVKPGADEL
jgi:hypothetical protein